MDVLLEAVGLEIVIVIVIVIGLGLGLAYVCWEGSGLDNPASEAERSAGRGGWVRSGLGVGFGATLERVSPFALFSHYARSPLQDYHSCTNSPG